MFHCVPSRSKAQLARNDRLDRFSSHNKCVDTEKRQTAKSLRLLNRVEPEQSLLVGQSTDGVPALQEYPNWRQIRRTRENTNDRHVRRIPYDRNRFSAG